MWVRVLVLSLVLGGPPSASPVLGTVGEQAARQALLAEINGLRRQAGLETLALDPALTTIAREQVANVARSGRMGTDPEIITSTTHRLYREGYAAHRWSEGTLIAVHEDDLLGQWRQAQPDFHTKVTAGDFEDVGIALGRFRGRPLVSMVVALKTRTYEWRQAEPLRDLDRVRREALATVNQIRGDRGLPAVRPQAQLDEAAQRHAEDMLRRAYYDHTSPEGTTAGRRVRDTGHSRARGVAENIAKGPFGPSEVVHRWMNSSGHRQNILKRRATEMGLGVAFGENANGFEVVWVQVFASTRD